MTQPTQDIYVGLAVPYNATITPFCVTPSAGPAGAGLGGYPADDDPRFPYSPRWLHATGFQFDLLSLRILPSDYASGVLDELGHPILDEYGSPIV